MHLKSLYIEEYKNIKKQTFDFSGNTGYIALIGLNGSGKSNLLEAIGLIFNGLLNNQKIPFVYEIQYEHEGKTYLRKPYVSMIDGNKVKDAEMLYPSSVIACYSGEDLRLWHLAFEDYYMNYFKKAIDNLIQRPSLFYISKYCWNIALLSLLCSDDLGVKDFLSSTLNITRQEDVSVRFDFSENENYKDHVALRWINRLREECFDKEGKANIRSFLSYEIPLIPARSKESTLFHYLFLLSQPKKNTNKGNPVDRYITNINIENKGVSTSDLSEGHKKLILIECITKVLGDDRALVLLDEPDSHVHIALKNEVLNCIDSFSGQTLLTTHSPLFVNQMIGSNVFPISNGCILNQEKRSIIKKIANNEINIIDSACIVSSKYVLVLEGPDDIYHIKAAISAFSGKNEKFKSLYKLSFLFMGGAKEVDHFFDDILEPLYDTMDRIIFAFDYDGEGREGAKMVQNIIDKGNDKLKYLFYHRTYPIVNSDLDFYLEDFFERTAYNDIQLPVINGVPSFAELKKATTWANSIKNRIQKHKRDNSLTPNDYNGFQGFLEQLILQLK